MTLNINGTTGISGVDGSVSAPAVTGTDSNTGITFPSADTIKFSTGGVERMSITNSGVTGVSGGISNVVEDTTPQLGGNLDLNSKNITGTGNLDITGNLVASGNLSVSSGVSTLGGSYVQGTGDGLLVYGSSSRNQGVYFDGASNRFRPTATSAYSLGDSSYRFHTIYSNNNLNTSDENLKNTITTSDLGLGFINKLRPVSYKWNQYEGQISDTKTHYGFVAQEVETVLTSESKTLDDFAGVFKPDDYKTDGTGGAMALAPTEFLSPLIKAVQELSAEVDTLKTKVAALEAG